ncbi:MAG TPA: hypothetical protein PLJ21_02885 [Pseudobdellovibrionaceae bacterium]|nr:hypothetical protein [Pseudobdellovibrionaceae bacterium]
MNLTVLSMALLVGTMTANLSSANVLQGSSDASGQISSDFAMAVNTAGASSWNTMTNMMTSSANATVGAYQGTKNLVLKSWNWSNDSFVAVFAWSGEFSQNPSEKTSESLNYVMTSTGNLVQASLNGSGKMINVVVTQSGNVLSAVGEATVGVAGSSVAAGKYLLDAAGNLWTKTKKVAGQVVTAANNSVPVTLSKNVSGDLLVVSKKASDVVVTGLKSSVKVAGNSSATSMEYTNKWIVKPVSKGLQLLSNGSEEIWVASADFLQRLKANSVETDLTNYSN